MAQQEKYDGHLAAFEKIAFVSGMEEYKRLYEQSIEDPETFWGQQAEQYLDWDKKWDYVLKYDFSEAKIEWFGGGRINVTKNCLDRHIDAIGDRIAYYWEGDDPNETRTITYRELYREVNRFAKVLQAQGIKKGDRIIIYMPMVIELAVAMLACARIGAIHSIVFGGFSADAIANRVKDSGARMIITSDGGYRAGKQIPIKANVDKALAKTPEVEKVIVFNRTNSGVELNPEKDVWWHEEMDKVPADAYVEPESMDAEDPLFILYTSGSTGKPKGVVHTQAGYLLFTAMTTKLVFDLKDDEIFWCTADIGWITGHSYIVYGPLANGITNIMFEGVPSYPDFSRFWAIVEKYRVNKFYTAPTAIRALAREGDDYVKKHDLSSLKLIGTVGEPINPEAWRWYYRNVGGGRCPVIDTWWQTETGGHMLTPLPGVGANKPGSCQFPFFGVEPVIIDDTGQPVRFPSEEGLLCIKKPWPAIARTVYGDHERFRETYFSQAPGMYFTGDAARCDEEGYYWIIGRIDDVLNVSGHRLGTAELESALVLHKAVAEAAVVDFPHEIKGQGIYAFVILQSGVESSEELRKELIQQMRTEIGPIATPDVIQFTDGLPKTRSGKIMRRILKKIAAGKTDELGDTSTIADESVIERLIENSVDLAYK